MKRLINLTKTICILLILALICEVFVGTGAVYPTVPVYAKTHKQDSKKAAVKKAGRKKPAVKKSPYAVSDDEVNTFFSKSAIIGNSVGLGLKYYFNTKPKGYLGSPKMLVWGSYSFVNDFLSNQKYMIHYQGKPMKARYAVKACKAKHVLINMGTNDFNTSQSHIYEHYKKYIGEIKKTNPDVDIYILASTPVRKPTGRLNNHETNELNKKMKALAEKTFDMYYIDINTPMKDSSGSLKAGYVSDGFVHLTSAAYKVWTDTMVRDVRQLLKKQKKAKTLIKNAAEKMTDRSFAKAKDAVNELDKSTLKKNLKNRLKKIKKKLKKKKAAKIKKKKAAEAAAAAAAQQKTADGSPAQPLSDAPVSQDIQDISYARAFAVKYDEPQNTTAPDVPAEGTPAPVQSTTVPAEETPDPGQAAPAPEPTSDPDALTASQQSQVNKLKKSTVKKVKIKRDIEKKVILTWKKQKGADYYTVYRSEDKKSGYEQIAKTKKPKYVDKRAQKRTTYYYRIRAHKTINNTTYDGKMCKPVEVYVMPKVVNTVIAGECFVEDMTEVKGVFGKNISFVPKIGVNTYTMQHNNYFTYQGQSVTGLEMIAYHNPDRVYFIIGANESAWTTTSYTMKNYESMRKLLKRVNSNIQIVLVKIGPFGSGSSPDKPTDAQRNKFNKAYKDYAASHDDVYFCPATDVLEDGSAKLQGRYNGGDSIHWTHEGTVKVSEAIKSWSKKTFGGW